MVPERFDILPLLVCTDGAVSMFCRGCDLACCSAALRLLRSMDGRDIAIAGSADLRGRCVMTTYDRDTADCATRPG